MRLAITTLSFEKSRSPTPFCIATSALQCSCTAATAKIMRTSSFSSQSKDVRVLLSRLCVLLSRLCVRLFVACVLVRPCFERLKHCEDNHILNGVVFNDLQMFL